VGEFIAVDQWVQGIALNVQVVLRMLLPDRVAARIDLAHVIAIHHPLVLGAGLPALHARGGLRAHRLPAEVEGVAGLAAAEIMMLIVIAVFQRTLPCQSYSRSNPPLPVWSEQPSAVRPAHRRLPFISM
jgi:hypothetical protein